MLDGSQLIGLLFLTLHLHGVGMSNYETGVSRGVKRKKWKTKSKPPSRLEKVVPGRAEALKFRWHFYKLILVTRWQLSQPPRKKESLEGKKDHKFPLFQTKKPALARAAIPKLRHVFRLLISGFGYLLLIEKKKSWQCWFGAILDRARAESR
jgi:hypothetical protein